ncbi:unnamed protein product [Cylindrotheca closterium]|uniref:Uncharacterized protein n=1 Tax=Cylindrotheca closterium TaxID=2856 RepID=A0AAD2JKS1_9STRA|nr:unnamed protein product [Cylindrotheca closterium]
MLSLRSIIMTLFLLAMQPMAMPLMSANYTCPSMKVSSLADENVLSTVDFVGTTLEMGSTVSSFSLVEFIQSINYESIKAFAEVFNVKYEALTQELSPPMMSTKFELFNEKFEAFIQSINYESIKAFAEVFNMKCEAFAEAFFDAMIAKFGVFIEKFEAFIQWVALETSDTISSGYQGVYKKLESSATHLLAAAPAWPIGSFDPESTIRDDFDRVESFFKGPLVSAPVPPLLFLEDAQSIAMKVLDAISFGATTLSLLNQKNWSFI